MRRRSLGLTFLGSLFVALALYSTMQVYPPDPRGEGRIFGLLPEFTLSLLGGLLLATGTFHLVSARRQLVRLAWYPAWCLLGTGVVGAYLAANGSVSPQFYELPLVVGGALGFVREVLSWEH